MDYGACYVRFKETFSSTGLSFGVSRDGKKLWYEFLC